MKSVLLRLNGASFSGELCTIRDWLDAAGCNPLQFVYSCVGPGDAIRLRVDFASADEARDFAGRFGGDLVVTPLDIADVEPDRPRPRPPSIGVAAPVT